MAALAEQLPTTNTEDRLFTFELGLTSPLFNCNDNLELKAFRDSEASVAQEKLDVNRAVLMEGQLSLVPAAVDVLGTAKLVEDARDLYGDESEAYESYLSALFNDCCRLVAETERKQTWEYYQPIFQQLTPEGDDYLVNGVSINATVNNGLSPLPHKEEQQIRVHEYLEQATNLYISNSEQANSGISLVTIKQCPDYVIEDYKTDKRSAHGGYVPAIKKMVIQRVKFVEDGLYHEQLAIPGIHITHDDIVETLQEMGGLDQCEVPTKQQLRGQQFQSFADDPLRDLQMIFDQKASIRTGLNIFMGEAVAEDHPKDYGAIVEESIRRQEKQKDNAIKIMDFLIDKQHQKTDSSLADVQLRNFIKQIYVKEIENDPEKAAIIFDNETAERVRSLIEAKKNGDREAVKSLNKEILEKAPDNSYCTAGTCGTEAVSEDTTEGHLAREKGLVGELMKLTENECPFCHSKGTVIVGSISGIMCSDCGKSK